MRYVDACKACAWHIRLWRLSEPAKQWRVVYRCRSWRCEGECRLWKGAQDFCRIRDGILKYTHWYHVGLTYDPKRHPQHWKLFRDALHHWAKLRKRITREFGSFRYVQTWEVHRSGVPHVHILLNNDEWHARCRIARDIVRREWLEPHAVECGFGERTWVEGLYSKEGMAGYLVKLARELTGSGKAYQIPVDAPPHFRRLRASQGLLPPPYKNPDISGALFQCPIESMETERKTKRRTKRQLCQSA